MSEETKHQRLARLLIELDKPLSDVSAQDALEFRRDAYDLDRKEWCFLLGISVNHYGEFLNSKRELPKKAMINAVKLGVPAASTMNF